MPQLLTDEELQTETVRSAEVDRAPNEDVLGERMAELETVTRALKDGDGSELCDAVSVE